MKHAGNYAKKSMKRVELLAPAGGMEQFIAAVENGADAVYLGGSMFNARIGAGNFTVDEIREAAAYGHLRNVKTYVTMNTLLFDDELMQAAEYACKLYEAGVDALIIQDLGLGLAVKELIPDFEIHMSTQATVYDEDGVRAAIELGYSRTVLARELSLEKIRECCKIGEIEVFVHGALCICYSGQCQMSRYIGGRSGNRGMCAQPCRLPYAYYDETGGRIDEKYPLSPKDLCLIDSLGELIDAGVSSLKIEGRMKSAEYVGLVTSIYRKYIDEYYKNGKYTVSEKDRTDLMQVFNRGGFTEGYIHGDPGASLMSSTVPKNQGVRIGKIISTKKGSPYVTVELNGPLDMQDVIEIRAAKNKKPAFNPFDNNAVSVSAKVTYLKKESVNKAVIGDIKDEVSPGDEVYRLVSEELKKRFSAGDGTHSDGKKAGVKMTLLAKAGSELKLTVSDICTGISVSSVSVGYSVDVARNKATSQEEIKNQLSKTGSTAFYPKNIRLIADEDIFIPVSKINEIRRNALDELERLKLKFFERDIELRKLSCGFKGADKKLSEIRGTKRAPKSGEATVNNISQIRKLADKGIKVIGGRGLNITNGLAAEAYMKLGMSEEYFASVELLERDEMAGVPLMISEHEMKPGVLTDRKGAKYRVEFDKNNHKTYIYSK